jgi:hypothetical protein
MEKEQMAGELEIQFNFEKINEAISQLQELQNRAASCSRTQFFMSGSKGDSKTAMLQTQEALSKVANSTAIMIEKTIKTINEAALEMKQGDEELATSIEKNN